MNTTKLPAAEVYEALVSAGQMKPGEELVGIGVEGGSLMVITRPCTHPYAAFLRGVDGGVAAYCRHCNKTVPLPREAQAEIARRFLVSESADDQPE